MCRQRVPRGLRYRDPADEKRRRNRDQRRGRPAQPDATRDQRLDRTHELVGVAVEMAAAVDGERIAIGEVLHIIGQLARRRHARAIDQHRNDRKPVVERGRDLHPHRVVGIVDPLRRAVTRGHPFRPDDRDQHAAPAQRFLDGVAEIRSGGNAAGIEEDLARAQAVAQVIGNTTRDVLRVGAAI